MQANLSKFAAKTTTKIMKRRSLFLIGALGLSIAFYSCGNSDQVTKQQLYNNATLVDSEGFTFFKTSHEKIAYELEYANYAASVSSSSQVKGLADKLQEVYGSMLPELEELAASKQVVLPDPGALVFNAEDFNLEADSVQAPFDEQAYLAHALKAQKEILNQFKRASRNTDKELRQYSADRLEAVKSAFVQAGGEEDAGGHH